MAQREFILGQRKVSQQHPPLIVAEMSGNHQGSFEQAQRLIDSAASAGAEAIKFQTYTADTMTLDLDSEGFLIEDPESPWKGYTLHRLYEEAHLPWQWHEDLFQYARQRGLTPFSTPFDETAVDFLEALDVPCYKIASFENIDLPLIRKVSSTGKPVIISAGMAAFEELEEAVETARKAGAADVMVLHCCSAYPAPFNEMNLAKIRDIRERLNVLVGLSDHTLGNAVALASVGLGAVLIEKHLTECRADGGLDSSFSIEPKELRVLIEETQKAWEAIGSASYSPGGSERKSLVFRRSLYAVEDIEVGEAITKQNTRCIRPGYGLAPKYLDQVQTCSAKVFIKRGTPLSWDLLTAPVSETTMP